jgi:endoglucanase
MAELLPFLKSLLSVSGLSAYEMPAALLIEQEWRPLLDELQRSRLGSLHGLKRGSGKHAQHSVMIVAHMDSIGLMVSRVVDGLIYFAPMGDIDLRVLPGTPVRVHAASADLPGVIGMPAAPLLPERARDNFPAAEYLVIDTGLLPAQVSKRVQPGDLISFSTQPTEMAGKTLSGHSADNRASIAALTAALRELQGQSHAWDVWAVASVQEETTFAGAATSSYQLRPDIAIVLDVTFGTGPGASGWNTFPLGKGPTLSMGPNIHPFLFQRFRQLSERLGLDLPVEPIPAASQTDAEAVQVSANGIPCMLLGIPLRYMHTPVELMAVEDIERTGHLLAEFIVSLEEDFLQRIQWD